MNSIFMETVKWIIVVAVTGFIAYLGRFVAQLIIEYFRKNKKTASPQSTKSEAEVLSKAQKKKDKALAKLLKKRGG